MRVTESSFCHALCSAVEHNTSTCPLFATIAVGRRCSHGSPLAGGGTCSGWELRPGGGLGERPWTLGSMLFCSGVRTALQCAIDGRWLPSSTPAVQRGPP